MRNTKPKPIREKPFRIILSSEQQNYIKEISDNLQTLLDIPLYMIDSTDYLKEYLIAKAIFKQLTISQRNLFLVYTYGEYKSVTALARDLGITRATMCKQIKQIRQKIEKFVNKYYADYLNKIDI